MRDKKNIITTLTIVLVVAIIGGLAYFRNRSTSSPDTDVYTPSSAPTIRGQAACLPLKSGEESTPGATNCHLGLKNDTGMYLELQNMPQNQLKAGQTIEVKGVFTTPSEDTPYQTSGTIRVE